MTHPRLLSQNHPYFVSPNPSSYLKKEIDALCDALLEYPCKMYGRLEVMVRMVNKSIYPHQKWSFGSINISTPVRNEVLAPLPQGTHSWLRYPKIKAKSQYPIFFKSYPHLLRRCNHFFCQARSGEELGGDI